MEYVNINFNGIIVEVDYEYIDEEPMVMNYGDGTGHPGSLAESEIHEVKHCGESIMELIEAGNLLEDLEKQVTENHKK